MKTPFLFAAMMLAAVPAAWAAETASPSAPASPAAADNFTLTAEGTIPLDVTFKVIATSDGPKIAADGPISYAGVDDGKLHFEATVTAVKGGYRVEYTLMINVPVSATYSVPGATTTPITTKQARSFTTKASPILQLNQPLVVATTNGKTITLTLAKDAAAK